jgi:hypothetical protein
MRIFTEFGIGNGSFASTEIEFADGTEKRFNSSCFFTDFCHPYIRIWIGTRVVVIDSSGVAIKIKPRSAFKILIGFAQTV